MAGGVKCSLQVQKGVAMAIQPCQHCGRATESDEYYMHNVACSSEPCQAAKRADEIRAGVRYEKLPDGGTRVHIL